MKSTIERLAELAKGATQGTWAADSFLGSDAYDDPCTPFVEIAGVRWYPTCVDVPAAVQTLHNANYIAACNPAAIAQAHAEYAELERRNAELVDALREAVGQLHNVCAVSHQCNDCVSYEVASESLNRNHGFEAALAHSAKGEVK